jgi:hypothetical protein
MNGGPLSHISGFFTIIGGFIPRLTKLLLRQFLFSFCDKSGIFQFIRALLSMREFLRIIPLTNRHSGQPLFRIIPENKVDKITSSQEWLRQAEYDMETAGAMLDSGRYIYCADESREASRWLKQKL